MSTCKLLLAEDTSYWKLLFKGYYALSWTCVLLQLGSLFFNLEAQDFWAILLELALVLRALLRSQQE